MSARKNPISQFKRPRGPLGRLAGWIMANRPSSRLRNTRTVDLLDLRLDDRILEEGYGPGLALRLAANSYPTGGSSGAIIPWRCAIRTRHETESPSQTGG